MSDDLVLQIETTEQELELVLEEQAEEIDLPVLMLGEVGPTGKSAYQIAVKNGYTGTEAEWLASIGGDISDTTFDTNLTLLYSIAKL